MVAVETEDAFARWLHLPRSILRFPLTWLPPESFRADDRSSWPAVEGRLEYVNGRIHFMPPCGEEQQDTASDLTGVLYNWMRAHPEFVVGSNEAGMLLGGEARAADAAVWRRADAGSSQGLRRKAPILAAEIAGQDEGADVLREKARWYLARGVAVVWIVVPATREVVVITSGGETRHPSGTRLSPHPSLPDLAPAVGDLFWQLDQRR